MTQVDLAMPAHSDHNSFTISATGEIVLVNLPLGKATMVEFDADGALVGGDDDELHIVYNPNEITVAAFAVVRDFIKHICTETSSERIRFTDISIQKTVMMKATTENWKQFEESLKGYDEDVASLKKLAETETQGNA